MRFALALRSFLIMFKQDHDCVWNGFVECIAQGIELGLLAGFHSEIHSSGTRLRIATAAGPPCPPRVRRIGDKGRQQRDGRVYRFRRESR